MQNLTDEERVDKVSRILRSMRGFEAIVGVVKSPDLRRSLYAALRSHFDMVAVPDPTTDAMFTKVLASASIGILPLRESDPKFTDTVGLIAQALRMSYQPSAKVSTPAPPTSAGHAVAVSAPVSQGIQPVPVKSPEVANVPKSAPPVSSKKPVPEDNRLALFAHLPPERRSGRRLDPLTLLLPGPARDGEISEITDWISGRPWAEDVLALRLAPTDPSAVDEIADLEAEGFSAPKTLRDRTGLRPFMLTEGRERGISFLHNVGRDLGVYAVTCDKAMDAFRDALERTIERHWPAQVASLAAFGAKLVPGEDVPELLADAWDIESFFLREMRDDFSCPGQDYRGSLSPDCALEPGVCFERAAFLFLAVGRSLSSALMESVIEFRNAQVMRGLDQSQIATVSRGFDAIFFSDCARPLEDYKLCLGVAQPIPDPMPEF